MWAFIDDNILDRAGSGRVAGDPWWARSARHDQPTKDVDAFTYQVGGRAVDFGEYATPAVREGVDRSQQGVEHAGPDQLKVGFAWRY